MTSQDLSSVFIEPRTYPWVFVTKYASTSPSTLPTSTLQPTLDGPPPSPSHVAFSDTRSPNLPPIPDDIIFLVIESIGTVHYDMHKGHSTTTPVEEAQDRRTLAACCLLSKAFLNAARAALYYKVTFIAPRSTSNIGFNLLPGNISPSAPLLLDTLLHAPHLATQIRHVTLGPWEWARAPQSIVQSSNLKDVLAVCATATHLHLQLYRTSPIDAVDVLRGLREARLPLQSLRVQYPGLEARYSDPSTLNALQDFLVAQTSLTSLHLTIPAGIAWRDEPPTFKLKRLALHRQTDIEETINYITQLSRDSLESLTLTMRTLRDLDLSAVPNLKTLRLPAFQQFGKENNTDPLYAQLYLLPLHHLYISRHSPPSDPEQLRFLPLSLVEAFLPFYTTPTLKRFLSSDLSPLSSRGFHYTEYIAPIDPVHWEPGDPLAPGYFTPVEVRVAARMAAWEAYMEAYEKRIRHGRDW